MGCNKALINYGGRTLIERLVEVVRPLAGELLISANQAADYKFLDLPVVEDIYAGQGPLAGLHAAMLRSEKPRFLLLACDMPNVTERLLRAVLDSADGCDAIVPRASNGRSHPLCGIYWRTCFEFLEWSLSAGRNRVGDFLSSSVIKVRYLDTGAHGIPDRDLINLNDANDLSSLSSSREPGNPSSAC